MEHLFIINPTAGKVDKNQELTEKINAVRTEDKVTVMLTEKPGDATDFVKEYLSKAEDFVSA